MNVELQTTVDVQRPSMRKRLAFSAIFLILAAVVLFLLSRAGSFLVVDNPQPSDAVVVLESAGDTPGYDRAVLLKSQGYAKTILLDAGISHDLYGRSEAELAAEYLVRTGQTSTQICPTVNGTLFDEALDVKRCLDRIGARSAILMTSDFETRRTLDIFQKRLPQYRWFVAAGSTPYHYAEAYWKHRGWAKTVLQEWEDLLWWKLIEQRRKDVVLR
ncbi:MAG: YdcF family protein [Candidatus Korobacteraceae bacterium]